MTLQVEENYAFGIPQTAVAGWAPPGAAWHWSAGGPGRVGWEGTIRHLIDTRWTVNASYHGGLWCEHAANHVGCRTIIQWIVPTTKAAHSISPSSSWQVNPNKPRTLQDIRFTEVRRILGAKASDPNAGCVAVAYAGMPADLERDLACPVFRADVQDLVRQFVAHPAVIDRPHFGHGWIQPIDRYEMDVATDFVALLYAATATPIEENEVKFRNPIVTQWWTTKTGEATRFTRPDGTTGTFTAPERVKSVAEFTGSDDRDMRLLDYGPNHEALVIWRYGLDKPETRIVGSPEATVVVKEVPTGVPQADFDAARAQIAALNKRIATKDTHISQYPKG